VRRDAAYSKNRPSSASSAIFASPLIGSDLFSLTVRLTFIQPQLNNYFVKYAPPRPFQYLRPITRIKINRNIPQEETARNWPEPSPASLSTRVSASAIFYGISRETDRERENERGGKRETPLARRECARTCVDARSSLFSLFFLSLSLSLSLALSFFFLYIR